MRLFKRMSIANLVSNLYAPTSIPIDPYWANVVLAMHMEGADGSTAFIDLKGHAISVYNSAKISTALSKFGTSCFKSISNAGRLVVTSTDFNFGTAPYTMEGWFYFGRVDRTYCFDGAGNDNHVVITPNGANATIGWPIFAPMSEQTSAVPINLNTWYYIAAVRNGATATIYVNGVAARTSAISAGQAINPAALTINGYGGGGGYGSSNIYIDDVRVTKGIARYTANFTVPAQAFPDTNSIDYYWDYTVLLMHMDDLTDAKSHIISNNTAVIDNNPVKFGGGCLNFNGISRTTTFSYSADFALSGDFTIEGWFNFLYSPYVDTNGNHFVTLLEVLDADGGTNLGQNGFIISAYDSAKSGTSYTHLFFETFNNGTYSVVNTPAISGGISLNAWHHIAYSKSGTSLFVFIDGIKVATLSPATPTFTTNSTLKLGYHNRVGFYDYFKGYIDDLRITKGIARYTSNFSVPTAALPNAPTIDPYWLNTSLAMHCDNLVDAKGNVISNNGVTVDETGTKKYGTGCLSFAGGAYFTYPNAPSSNFADGDFTIEMWVRHTSSTTGRSMLYNQWMDGGGTDRAIWLAINNNKLETWVQTNVGQYGTGGGTATLSLNTWYHVALVRRNNVLYTYVNGVQDFSVAISGSINNTTLPIQIGVHNNGTVVTADPFTGYLDDIRVTKGVARYLGNFIPSSLAFLNQ